MTPAQYCQEKAAKSGSSFYYSFLFLPEQQRSAITALYAFCREVDDIVDTGIDPAIMHRKLDWWRTELTGLFAGHPQHPVSHALQPAIEHYKLPQELFVEIIDGMTMDIEQVRYANFSELALYCHRVAGVIGLLSAEIFGYKDRQTLKYAHDLGTAFQLTNILRDISEDARRGRIYLPQDELAKFGVTEQDILHNQNTAAFTRLMEFQFQRASAYYRHAYEKLPDADRYTQRTGLIMAAIYQAILAEIKKDQFRVLQHRISLTPLRKLWLAWKTMYTEKRRYKKWQRLNPQAN
ncbi:MAG: presqualene diphosphate synthase HpnD [Gammaproteobacteria bacterium]|nr:presqualene diphosphate synthase HpnD [Gammaproteobacteria bacterium]MDH5652113.1 presqualene diphosphate synthase HpnD [Gammaproteobacteria bacterium]